MATISFKIEDNRFDDMELSEEGVLDTLKEMIVNRVYDITDGLVSSAVATVGETTVDLLA